MRKTVRLGDIIRVPTNRGIAYAQITHKVRRWGHLIRVFPGFFSEQPDLADLTQGPEVFVTFFPAQAAVNKGIFKVIANEAVPPERQSIPVFKARGFIDRQGTVINWWIVERNEEGDDVEHGPFKKLTDDQMQYPEGGVCNDTFLVETLEEIDLNNRIIWCSSV